MQFNEKNIPIYMQIAELIGGYIIRGEWLEGERIPSVRELGLTLVVNPATVLRAYDELGSQGVVEQRRGIGYFVCEGAIARVHEKFRKEFMEITLPKVFTQMKELGIAPEEVMELYNSHT